MDDELRLADYFNLLRKYWAWGLMGFLIVFGAIAAYTYLSEPVYEAKNLVLIGTQDEVNFLLGSTTPKTSDLETQKIIIQSPSVMYPIYSKYGEDTFELTVNSVRNSNILEIVVDTYAPERAVIIANAITDSYINYTAEAKATEAEASIDFITEKMAALDEELNLLDLDLTVYKRTEDILTRREQLAYTTLQREITAKTKIYDYLLAKREEATIAANLKNANVKVIEYAQIPLKPIKPNIPLNLALGAILGIAAGVGFAVMAKTLHIRTKTKRRFL